MYPVTMDVVMTCLIDVKLYKKLLLHNQKSLHLCPDKFQKCQEEDCDCLPLSGDWPVGARPGKKQQILSISLISI